MRLTIGRRNRQNAKRFTIACAEVIEFSEDIRTLFLPVETLIAAFG